MKKMGGSSQFTRLPLLIYGGEVYKNISRTLVMMIILSTLFFLLLLYLYSLSLLERYIHTTNAGTAFDPVLLKFTRYID